MTASETRIPFAEASYTRRLRRQSRICARRLPARLYARWSRRRPSTIIIRPSDRLEMLKVQEIPSGYDPRRYATERLMVPARDGTADPGLGRLSPRASERNGQGQLFLYAYGAYGHRHPAELLDQPASACSTAAGPAPSPISAAATISAMTGFSTASRPSGPTRSTISSMPRSGLIARRLYAAPAISRSTAARPAAS